jgi:tRNA (uracil-5-)-methyltransferase TRM9
MNPDIITALAELNRAFYTRFAGDFARTRRAWPPGFDLILPYIRPAANLVDLGCGNARLLSFLSERGWQGGYVGVDASPLLLEIAEATAREVGAATAAFLQLDLLAGDWVEPMTAALPPATAEGPSQLALAALAVLHHIPGATARVEFLARCRSLLPPGGLCVVSTWQFLDTPRLRGRILPWSAVGLSEGDIEPGDYLLPWGEGAAGQRYCAAIDADTLDRLATAAGLETVASFRADGHEGDLNLYAVLKRPLEK